MTKTISPEIAQQNRSYKLLLIVAMVSMTMMFAGITSAFFVSKSRVDWMKDFVMPTPFFISTICIVLVSVCFFLAKKAIKKDNQKSTSIFLLGALILGIAFVIFQFKGFEVMMSQGNYVTGPQSNITSTFLYLVVVTHLAHVVGGFISLLIIIYNHFKQKYNSSQFIGIELGAMYWHFLDFLWIYLFLFLYFFK
ncbi:MAG: cytochrome c oxidase subunit 3 [Flavobacteriales bacterium]|nr:cytochrome c oxidase subunit 3 [Flavobacteriales bacterium]